MPSQWKVRYGWSLSLFHASLMVWNQSIPVFLRICGSAPVYPKVSGSQHSRRSSSVRPNSCCRNRRPMSACRTSDSPPGMLVSVSTQNDPCSSSRPAATASFMRANRWGCRSFIHCICCGWEVP